MNSYDKAIAEIQKLADDESVPSEDRIIDLNTLKFEIDDIINRIDETGE